MLLTVATTHRPATDLGFLLHKNPDHAQVFTVSSGRAHVVYPQATEERTTAALILEIDPIGLVRGAKGRADFALGHYVNDRPYAASSLLAVALGQVLRTAMKGECKERPRLAATPIPLEITVPALPCRGGAAVAEQLFAPLGWDVTAVPIPLDPAFPEWGESRYADLTLRGTLRLADALHHLYVLLPVLDDNKHYWVGNDEIDKLLRAGEGWLATHPTKDLIARRYLSHRRELTRDALARLAEVDDAEPEALDNAADEVAPKSVPLVTLRRAAVVAALKAEGARRVVDVGCGPGALLADLLNDASFTEIVGTDVSHTALALAARRLRLDRMPERRKARIQLLQGSVTYTDARLRGYDAVVLMEVIEHVDPPRVGALTNSVLGDARPRVVVVTTPNREHNVRYEMPEGSLRHPDHRFEWDRAEFAAWAADAAGRYGYAVRFEPVGPDDPEVGAPTQLAVFTR
jgi:3' terminal RNA ribose 2'-O-methyltransferase Hen1